MTCRVSIFGGLCLLLVFPAFADYASVEFTHPSTGETHRIYQGPGKAGNKAVYHSFYSPENDEWSKADEVSRPGNHECDDFSVRVDYFGGIYLAYVWQGPFEQIHIRRFDSVTGKWSPTVKRDVEGELWDTSISVYNKLFVAANSTGRVYLDFNKDSSPDDWFDPWGRIEMESEQPDPGATLHREGSVIWLTYVYDSTTLNYMLMDNSMDDAEPFSAPILNGDIKAAEVKVRELHGEMPIPLTCGADWFIIQPSLVVKSER